MEERLYDKQMEQFVKYASDFIFQNRKTQGSS
jgi:hypothetical protein